MAETYDITASLEQVETIVREELDALRQKIVENITRTGKRASGRTQDSLVVNVAQEGGSIVGTIDGRAFFGALEIGSRPWRNQYARPPKFFIEIIEDWMRDKGMTGDAGGIAYTIMRRGSAQYRNGARTDVYSDDIVKTMDEINRRVGGLFEAQIIDSLLRD